MSIGINRIGERNGRAKLTWRIVERLRKIYRKGQPFKRNPVSVLALAIKHDVSPGTMWSALSGKSWSRPEMEKNL